MSQLRAKIAEQLRTDIVDSRIPAGEIILERAVAARFDVSKTPAREALALLCEEGLVQLFPRRGYVVSALSLKQVVDTFDLRFILEGAAAERAAQLITADQLARLEELEEHDCCGKPGAALDHRLTAMEQSFDFHVLIARASGNAMLAEQIEKLLRASRRITSIGFVYGEHAHIVAALRTRNGSRARAAMENHLSSGRRAALRALAGSSGEDGRAGNENPRSTKVGRKP